MSSLRLWIGCVIAACVVAVAPPLRAELTALARIEPGSVRIVDTGAGAMIEMTLSQPVPWRVFTLDAPRRVIVDFSEVVWPEGISEASEAVFGVRTGRFRAGWSRMVLDLSGPYRVAEAGLEAETADGWARLTVRLTPTDEASFAAAAGMPPSMAFATPEPLRIQPAPERGGRLKVMIDPGHGGIDPGAEAGDLIEADLMLTFARELRETLVRSGGFDVAMTRREDEFVPLETRITLARAAGADVLLSLHADALPEDAGHASGATIYTLAEEASDLASQRLAERHNQADLLAGVDLQGQGDEIALILMELARRDTAPRADLLADGLVDALTAAIGKMNSRPRRSAVFSVLKAPDIPSVLIELGFLSSEKDRARLTDPAWRQRAAEGIRDGLRAWAEADAMRALLVRH